MNCRFFYSFFSGDHPNIYYYIETPPLHILCIAFNIFFPRFWHIFKIISETSSFSSLCSKSDNQAKSFNLKEQNKEINFIKLQKKIKINKNRTQSLNNNINLLLFNIFMYTYHNFKIFNRINPTYIQTATTNNNFLWRNTTQKNKNTKILFM